MGIELAIAQTRLIILHTKVSITKKLLYIDKTNLSNYFKKK